jgi:hypothetical protein
MQIHWIPGSFVMNYLSTAIRTKCLVSFTWTTLYDAINRRRTPHTCDFNEPRLSELMGGKPVSNFTQCVRPIYLQRAALSILYWQTPPQPDASPIVPSHTARKLFYDYPRPPHTDRPTYRSHTALWAQTLLHSSFKQTNTVTQRTKHKSVLQCVAKKCKK